MLSYWNLAGVPFLYCHNGLLAVQVRFGVLRMLSESFWF